MQQQQQWRPDSPAMTFDEVSMERSKSFVKALQELKNLRPQLYSAAEYCEKSYLHNEQKQMVLDNLKDYAVRALVNAVDHLGTVAYKLTDLFEQQTLDVSTVELKISCLNQQIHTCQTYIDKEGLRQQEISAATLRHHKRYILPNSVGQKLQRTQLSPTDDTQNHNQARPQPHPSAKTLFWHLASETNSAPSGAPKANTSKGDSIASKITPESFHLLDTNESANKFHSATHRSETKSLQSFGQRDTLELPKPLSAYRSFENPCRQLYRPPARSRSMLSVFFAKTKFSKTRKGYAQ